MVLLAAAPAAHATCDTPTAAARATHLTHGQQAPLALGDSTMLWAVPFLARRGFDANAHVCRSWTQGLQILAERERSGRLPSLVVMALGANSWVRAIDIERALRLLGPKRTLAITTHRTWFGKPGPDTQTIRRVARRYRKRVKLIDWVHYAAPHPAWFVNDGLHPTEFGARKFAAFIATAVDPLLQAK